MFKALFSCFMLLLLANCQLGMDPETIVDYYRPAIFHLVNDKISCTSFYVGDELLVTAKHCMNDELAPNLEAEDLEGNVHKATLLYLDPNNDVAILQISEPLRIKLNLWGRYSGEIRSGQQIMTMGFPGYNSQNFTFEVGYLSGVRILDDHAFLIAKSVAYSGESGGPVVSVKNGQVVGMAIAMAERVQILGDDGLHQHNTLSIILPWNVIQHAINHAMIDLD